MAETYSRILCFAESFACPLSFPSLALVYGICWVEPFPVRFYELVSHDEYITHLRGKAGLLISAKKYTVRLKNRGCLHCKLFENGSFSLNSVSFFDT
jgi:hypothetical protein